MRRSILGFAFLATLAACGAPTADLAEPVEPLGDFQLGFAEVVAPNARKLLISEDVSSEEWVAEVDRAVETRFGRFEGTRLYHFGISVEEYSIPIQAPLVPGRSALALRVTVWDDAKAAKMNEETEVITVIKVLEAKLFTTRDQKVTALAEEAAAKIEDWLRKQQAEAGWFAGAVAPGDADPAASGSAAPAADALTPTDLDAEAGAADTALATAEDDV